MTTLAEPRVAPAWTPAVRQLGAVEARRMLRHPAYPIALIYVAVFTCTMLASGDGGTAANFVYLSLFLSLFLVYAPITFVVANRTSASTYQRRVRETLDGTPVDTRQRTLAVMVGLLRGPVLVSIAGMTALLVLGEFTTSATAVRSDAVYQRTALEYLQLPALVLGAGLLGIALARWLPRPGVLPLAALVLYLGNITMYQYADADLVHGQTWFVLWPVWIAGRQGELPRQPLGQEMWHLAYLLGLGVLAGIAALLRVGEPRRALCAAAVVVAAVTAVAAWLQLG